MHIGIAAFKLNFDEETETQREVACLEARSWSNIEELEIQLPSIQHIFMEHLLYTKPCARLQGCKNEQSSCHPCTHETCGLTEERGINQVTGNVLLQTGECYEGQRNTGRLHAHDRRHSTRPLPWPTGLLPHPSAEICSGL